MNLKNIVKTLLEVSADADGLPDASRIEAVCAYVSENFAPQIALKILRVYRRKVSSLLAQNSAVVASAGDLDNASRASLESFVKSQKEKAKIEFTKDDSLIAGIKVSIGDIVWENSVRMRLDELKQSLGA